MSTMQKKDLWDGFTLLIAKVWFLPVVLFVANLLVMWENEKRIVFFDLLPWLLVFILVIYSVFKHRVRKDNNSAPDTS